ncbi:MAG: TIGR02996 domain-containing protein [Gemmataceae bacterium]
MRAADDLLAAMVTQPEDLAQRLVFADWMEEHGGADGCARAQLLRLQVEREQTDDRKAQRHLDRAARVLLKGHRNLLGPLAPLLRRNGVVPGPPVLTVPSLALFLGAPWTEPQEGLLAAGSVWRGQLLQTPHAIPTTLELTARRAHLVKGRLVEDFTLMYGMEVIGYFHFRGIVVGRNHLLLVTYRTERAGVAPGLYTLRLAGGWLSGDWWVPSHGLRGRLRLRRVAPTESGNADDVEGASGGGQDEPPG